MAPTCSPSSKPQLPTKANAPFLCLSDARSYNPSHLKSTLTSALRLHHPERVSRSKVKNEVPPAKVKFKKKMTCNRIA